MPLGDLANPFGCLDTFLEPLSLKERIAGSVVFFRKDLLAGILTCKDALGQSSVGRHTDVVLPAVFEYRRGFPSPKNVERILDGMDLDVSAHRDRVCESHTRRCNRLSVTRGWLLPPA